MSHVIIMLSRTIIIASRAIICINIYISQYNLDVYMINK